MPGCRAAEPDPYKVKLWLDVLNDEDWGYVLEALSQKARWSAQLLAGIMPADIERAFAASGKRLFPFKLQEVRSECSCPDKANPCKHVSAVYYLMGDRFSEDPFVLFQLRGRTRAQLLAELAKRRREGVVAPGGACAPSDPSRHRRSGPLVALRRRPRSRSGGDHPGHGGGIGPRRGRPPAPGGGTAASRRPTSSSWSGSRPMGP